MPSELSGTGQESSPGPANALAMTTAPRDAGSAVAPLPDAYFAVPCARFGPSTLRASWWTLRAWRAARRRLPIDGAHTTVPPPPRLPAGATRGVQSVLRRVGATSLQRCLVLQAWLFACGEPYDVIVADDATDNVPAHSWLPFEAGPATSGFKEVTRIPASRS